VSQSCCCLRPGAVAALNIVYHDHGPHIDAGMLVTMFKVAHFSGVKAAELVGVLYAVYTIFTLKVWQDGRRCELAACPGSAILCLLVPTLLQ
jgi:hypothetical protein